MFRVFCGLIVALGISLVTVDAFALGIPPRAGIVLPFPPDRPKKVVVDYKTPPMQDSEVIKIPLGVKLAGVEHWAGAIMGVHILDNTEVDVTGISDAAGSFHVEPFGPASDNTQSQMKPFTLWAPNAMASGTAHSDYEIVPIFDITLHAKNTTPTNNSDTDIRLAFWNICHLPPSWTSDTIELKRSDWVWASSNWAPTPGDFRLPDPLPPTATNGHWVHVPFTTCIDFTQAVPGSNFIATFVNTAKIGIEHVPEPASMCLIVCGFAAAGMALFSRWRRKRLAA
jgi:hypothetical protein